MVSTEPSRSRKRNGTSAANRSRRGQIASMYVHKQLLLYFNLDAEGNSPAVANRSALSQENVRTSLSDTPNGSPTTPGDPLASFVADATSAAKSFGTWFKTTVNEKAPGLIEKTQKISQDVYSKSKVVATDVFEKTTIAVKRAGTAVEGFIESKLENSGGEKAEETQTSRLPQNLDESSPLAE